MVEAPPNFTEYKIEKLGENTPRETFEEIALFLEKEGDLGSFQNLKKYFEGDADRVKESVTFQENGTRVIQLIKKGDEVVGLIGFVGNDNLKFAELGIFITEKFRGSGITGNILFPNIIKTFQEEYQNKEKEWKLVVSTISPAAQGFLKKMRIKTAPSGTEGYKMLVIEQTD